MTRRTRRPPSLLHLAPCRPLPVSYTHLDVYKRQAYRIVRTKRQERERARRLQEEILRTPLEKFGDHEVEELSKKYEQGPAEAPTIAATVPTAAASAYAPPSGLQVGQTGNDPAEGAGRP